MIGLRAADDPIVDVRHIRADAWPDEPALDQASSSEAHGPQLTCTAVRRKIGEPCREACHSRLDPQGGSTSEPYSEVAFVCHDHGQTEAPGFQNCHREPLAEARQD